MAWKQSTWYVFHMLSLKFIEEEQEHYERFFESFKYILPCEKCLRHYQFQTSRPDLHISNHMNSENIFRFTIQLHNNVNSQNRKKIWTVEEAKHYYEKQTWNDVILKMMILEYVKYNFKKGPKKTEFLFQMLESLCHIYPNSEKRLKLTQISIPLRRETIREWLLRFFKIILHE
jgi:hypothetical protein